MLNATKQRQQFRELLGGTRCIQPASVYDPISSRLAKDLGYEIGMLAGSIASAAVLGAPDYVLLTLSEFAQQARRISRTESLPILVDADHGYGNALNVKRTVEELENAGVAAITIEDTLLPHSFNTDGPSLVSLEEGVGKMRAALSGRQDKYMTIAGRTSAVSISGVNEAIRRAQAYVEAGVDAMFFAGVTTRREIETIGSEIDVPIMVGGIPEELSDLAFLAGAGVRITLQGHLPYMAAVKAAYETLKALREGTPPSKLKNAVASDSLFGSATRRDHYDGWVKEFLR